MQAELSFIDLFLGASLVVQLVMIILFVLAELLGGLFLINGSP